MFDGITHSSSVSRATADPGAVVFMKGEDINLQVSEAKNPLVLAGFLQAFLNLYKLENRCLSHFSLQIWGR